MKKKLTAIIAIGLMAVAVILLAVYWPPFSGDDASGAIGKAERPGRENLEEPEIKLRTDLLRDTTMLKRTIKDLVQFYGFTFGLAEYIDTWLVPQLNKYYLASVASEDIKSIEDFGTFLKNNNNTLKMTLETLGGFYGADKVEITQDIENNLLSFVGYVNLLIVKDSVFDVVLARIDKYIKQTEQEKSAKKSQISNLKDIRDKFLVDNYILALALNQEDKIKNLSNIKLFNPNNLKLVLGSEIEQFESYQNLIFDAIKSNQTLNFDDYMSRPFLEQTWWISGLAGSIINLSYTSQAADNGLYTSRVVNTSFTSHIVNIIYVGCNPVGFVPMGLVNMAESQGGIDNMQSFGIDTKDFNGIELASIKDLNGYVYGMLKSDGNMGNTDILKLVNSNDFLKVCSFDVLGSNNPVLQEIIIESNVGIGIKPIDPED